MTLQVQRKCHIRPPRCCTSEGRTGLVIVFLDNSFEGSNFCLKTLRTYYALCFSIPNFSNQVLPLCMGPTDLLPHEYSASLSFLARKEKKRTTFLGRQFRQHFDGISSAEYSSEARQLSPCSNVQFNILNNICTYVVHTTWCKQTEAPSRQPHKYTPR